MRFEIRHATRFHYEKEVSESQNELRACPTTDEHQQLVHFQVHVDPAARTHSWVDYWGTRVDAFGLRLPHDRLSVVTEATVETHPRATPEASTTMLDLDDASFRDQHFEFLRPTTVTVPTPEVVEAMDALADSTDLVLDVIDRVASWVSSRLAYRSGATFVGTTLAEALDAGAGVCQDHAHAAVSACRVLGIPARYVSGYLFTADDAEGQDTDQDQVVVQTHAWFEASVPGSGWVALDPTNHQLVGERHITVGRARDYHDLPPLRGSFNGPQAASLEVEVQLRRFAAAEQQQQ